MSAELRKRVDDWANGWFVARTYSKTFGVTKHGQNYAVLVTQGLWYKIRVFVELQHPRYVSLSVFQSEKDPIIVYSCNTLGNVKAKLDTIEKIFRNPGMNTRFGGSCGCSVFSVHGDWSSDPDAAFERGDVLGCWFAGIQFGHTGIYIGNGKIVHMSGHGGGKRAGMVRRGNLIGDFVNKSSDSLCVIRFRVRIRDYETVARTAEEYADEQFRKGDYNIFTKNCQHFVTLCATGVGFLIMDGATPTGDCFV